MSRLARDGTAETVSRDQILRRERAQGNIYFSVQLTSNRISNLTRLVLTLAIRVTIYTCIKGCPGGIDAKNGETHPLLVDDNPFLSLQVRGSW